MNKGYFVHISDSKFMPEGADIRITRTDYYVNKPTQPKIYLSNKVTGRNFTNRQNQIVNQEQTIDRSRESAIQFARRRYRDAEETADMLRKALLNFSEGISPVTVNTMQLLVGDESLQFRFVNQKTDPVKVVPHNIVYDPITQKLYSSNGIMQHMTLGINDISSSHGADAYFFWDMDEYISPVLDDPDKRYYLYAKCTKTGNKTDGTGIFLLSETAIAMDSEEDYYYFLTGTLNSEFEDNRSFVTLHGFSAVLPGQFVTDRIVSSDGDNWFDLLNNAFRMGNNHSSLDWNVSKINALSVLNALISLNNNGDEIILNSEDNSFKFLRQGNVIGIWNFNEESSDIYLGYEDRRLYGRSRLMPEGFRSVNASGETIHKEVQLTSDFGLSINAEDLRLSATYTENGLGGVELDFKAEGLPYAFDTTGLQSNRIYVSLFKDTNGNSRKCLCIV